MLTSLEIACDNVPLPDAGSDLQLISGTDPVLIGETASYKCMEGGRFESDETLDSYNLTCLASTAFDTPTWPSCARSMLNFQA